MSSSVSPIADKRQLKKAEQHLKKHFDEAYYLIWRIGIETGLRITDITELRYDDIDIETRKVRVMENKGTRARQAKARLNVLNQVKEELLVYFQNNKRQLLDVYMAQPQDIISLIPAAWKSKVEKRIDDAVAQAAPRWRVAYLTKDTVRQLVARSQRWKGKDNGFVFSRSTLASNRARNQKGVISRQACWKVFSQLTDVLATIHKRVKVGCHSTRKSFARHLYFSSGKDISLLMSVIGHQSVTTTLRYIGVSDDEASSAQLQLHRYLH
ncbi:integrase [Photobacterium sanctipauli]|uniref:Integrase n=1 Tax=Photobacterium sanctipauli TaxID=1342794 RepID=A0A2T3NWL9_9GAMM|nr:tyrosine-type recombinase/integrase [Photobacterium sanctipauli]PSW20636.1 integrase [Photobacterium sanctipauli]